MTWWSETNPISDRGGGEKREEPDKSETDIRRKEVPQYQLECQNPGEVRESENIQGRSSLLAHLGV